MVSDIFNVQTRQPSRNLSSGMFALTEHHHHARAVILSPLSHTNVNWCPFFYTTRFIKIQFCFIPLLANQFTQRKENKISITTFEKSVVEENLGPDSYSWPWSLIHARGTAMNKVKHGSGYD